MDELQCITTGVMSLVVCDIFYQICPSKVRAYNSNEVKKLLVDYLMYVLLLICGYKGKGGIQQQEYIMTFNEVMNIISRHTVLLCFIISI